MADTMDIWASRVKNADPATYVGQVGRIFYYPDSGTLRISDGSTPGGLPINAVGNLADIAIANFVFNGSEITTSVANADIAIDTNGLANIILDARDTISSGNIDIYGGVNIYSSANVVNFSVGATGAVTMTVPDSVSNIGAVEIVGDTTGSSYVPNVAGVMLHVTGQANLVSRIYNDGSNNPAAFVGRRFNGNVNSPTAVLNGETIVAMGGTAFDGTNMPNVAGSVFRFVSTGNQTVSNHGGRIEAWTTPENTTTLIKNSYFQDYSFYANNVITSGNVTIKATGAASNVAVLQVTNNSDGNVRYPALANVVAQFTGKDDKTPYIVFDSYGNVANVALGGEFVFRTARGNLATPAAVQTNDALGKVGAAGWGTTGYGGVYASSIEFAAAGNFTDVSRPGKILFKAIPDNSTTPSTALTLTPTTATFNAGMRMSNAWITLPAGTASEAPLKFTTASALLTTSTPGAINYDGTVFYATPMDLERGIIPAQQQFVLNAARNLTAGTTAAQSFFGVSVGLSANTRYYYEINAYIVKNGSGSNQPTINYGISPTTGSLFSHFYTVNSSVTATVAAVASGSQMFNYITTGFATGVPITAAMPINTSYSRVLIKGYIDVNTAATIDFQIAFSDAPNTSASVQPKSGVYIYPVGPAGANTSVGTWT